MCGSILDTRGFSNTVKKCGCIGHYTSHYLFPNHVAHARIRRKLEAFERTSYRVLFGPMNVPYYTNMEERLPDKFRLIKN